MKIPKKNGYCLHVVVANAAIVVVVATPKLAATWEPPRIKNLYRCIANCNEKLLLILDGRS